MSVLKCIAGPDVYIATQWEQQKPKITCTGSTDKKLKPPRNIPLLPDNYCLTRISVISQFSPPLASQGYLGLGLQITAIPCYKDKLYLWNFVCKHIFDPRASIRGVLPTCKRALNRNNLATHSLHSSVQMNQCRIYVRAHLLCSIFGQWNCLSEGLH